ncbi:MAG: FKBP-type peptidyl-prolyl cis-trans isomerase [Bacteroidota bacterium]
MRKLTCYFILFLILVPSIVIGQNQTQYYPSGKKKYEVKTQSKGFYKVWYYENGKKKSQAFFDKAGTWIGIKRWNEQGKLTENRDFESERKQKGAVDLSHIAWPTLDSVSTVVVSSKYGSSVPQDINKGDTLLFHYKCLDYLGYEYDNSFERNIPLLIVVGNTQFLPAFTEEVSKLSPGDKAYIRIPPAYGYGNKPAGNFPPNTTLVYYVEILEIRTGIPKR